MARLPLPLGSWGLIRTTRDTRGTGATTRFRATATFRDFDGTTRQVEAAGRSKTAAEQTFAESSRASEHKDAAATSPGSHGSAMPLTCGWRAWTTWSSRADAHRER
jgi:hypothetical protein